MSDKKKDGWGSLVLLFVVAVAIVASFSLFDNDVSFAEMFIIAIVNLPLLVVSLLGGALAGSWLARNTLDDSLASIGGAVAGFFIIFPILLKLATSLLGI